MGRNLRVEYFPCSCRASSQALTIKWPEEIDSVEREKGLGTRQDLG